MWKKNCGKKGGKTVYSWTQSCFCLETGLKPVLFNFRVENCPAIAVLTPASVWASMKSMSFHASWKNWKREKKSKKVSEKNHSNLKNMVPPQRISRGHFFINESQQCHLAWKKCKCKMATMFFPNFIYGEQCTLKYTITTLQFSS